MKQEGLSFSGRDRIVVEGKEYLYLAGTDYHRMSRSPLIAEAVAAAVKEYGLGSTGSRVTTGNHRLYQELEAALSGFFITESALVLPSGYLSNTCLLEGMAEDFDLFLIDEKAHSSLFDALKGIHKRIVRFPFCDPGGFEAQLRKHLRRGERPLLLTDGVFPARGELAPLEDYARILLPYDGRMLVDDAHAMAILGKTGKGSWEESGIDRSLVFQTGTLSKGFGCFGGLVCGSLEQVERIKKKSRAYSGSTGLPLPLLVAGISSLAYLSAHQELISGLRARTRTLKKRFLGLGFDLPDNPVPIFSITFYDEQKNHHLARRLLEHGIYPSFVHYPGAPAGGHFRFVLSSQTSEEQVELLFSGIASLV